MFFTIKKLFRIIKYSKINNLFKIFTLILLNSLFEVISIGILIPFIALILKPEFFNEFKLQIEKFDFLNYQFLYQINEKEFILLLGYVTLILYLFKYTINIFYSWYLNETKIDYEKAIGLKILENLSRTSNLTFLELPMSRIL